jgi:hypothetical protein
MRVKGTSDKDMEFKEFQRKLINGEDPDGLWNWLVKNIKWVEQTSLE